MTIAAGFLCNDGALLCADTEHSGWTLKFDESKLGHFEVPGGKIAFALSGNSPFAWAAVQKCHNQLQSVAPENALTELGKLLAQEYRHNVLNHPNQATDSSLGYQLLIAFWQPLQGVTLFITNQTTIRKVQSFECIGKGSELASFLIRPAFYPHMPERNALSLAAYALSGVKESISGCGGTSVFLLLQNDGSVGTVRAFDDGNCKHAEDYAKSFDYLTRRLWMALVDERLEASSFESFLSEEFNRPLLEAHGIWVSDRQQREANFRAANPRLDATEAKRLFLRLSMGFLPNQPLSSELLTSSPKDARRERISSGSEEKSA